MSTLVGKAYSVFGIFNGTRAILRITTRRSDLVSKRG
jgi:hypothetical protein